MNKPVRTTYSSKEVPLPPTFLASEPPDAKPMVITPIEFENTALPQYKGAYAVVIDNVLSQSECDEVLAFAESSVPDADRKKNSGSPWAPARVNVGHGHEVLVPEYRNSDRIIWDCQEVADRIWARLATVDGILDRLGRFNDDDLDLGWKKKKKAGMDWEFHKVNKRLRFLKYGVGQFFRPHCDGYYSEEGPHGQVLRTHFTVHLYLNDSRAEAGEGAQLMGGATTFFSPDERRRLDVNPKAGRVLIFQHKLLLHSGDDVLEGYKYTVRTDIMYELKRVDGEE